MHRWVDQTSRVEVSSFSRVWLLVVSALGAVIFAAHGTYRLVVDLGVVDGTVLPDAPPVAHPERRRHTPVWLPDQDWALLAASVTCSSAFLYFVIYTGWLTRDFSSITRKRLLIAAIVLIAVSLGGFTLALVTQARQDAHAASLKGEEVIRTVCRSWEPDALAAVSTPTFQALLAKPDNRIPFERSNSVFGPIRQVTLTGIEVEARASTEQDETGRWFKCRYDAEFEKANTVVILKFVKAPTGFLVDDFFVRPVPVPPSPG